MTQASSLRFQTEFEFVLPKGYVDQTGILHRHGIMRLATARDELLPLADPRVQNNPAYLACIVLANVITRLGDVKNIDVKVIEGLFAQDFDYLQHLYEKINGSDDPTAAFIEYSRNEDNLQISEGGLRVRGEA
jgi:hypothetical protein